MSEPGEFTYRRIHRATRELLFDCMTQPEHLTHFRGLKRLADPDALGQLAVLELDPQALSQLGAVPPRVEPEHADAAAIGGAQALDALRDLREMSSDLQVLVRTAGFEPATP